MYVYLYFSVAANMAAVGTALPKIPIIPQQGGTVNLRIPNPSALNFRVTPGTTMLQTVKGTSMIAPRGPIVVSNGQIRPATTTQVASPGVNQVSAQTVAQITAQSATQMLPAGTVLPQGTKIMAPHLTTGGQALMSRFPVKSGQVLTTKQGQAVSLPSGSVALTLPLQVAVSGTALSAQGTLATVQGTVVTSGMPLTTLAVSGVPTTSTVSVPIMATVSLPPQTLQAAVSLPASTATAMVPASTSVSLPTTQQTTVVASQASLTTPPTTVVNTIALSVPTSTVPTASVQTSLVTPAVVSTPVDIKLGGKNEVTSVNVTVLDKPIVATVAGTPNTCTLPVAVLDKPIVAAVAATPSSNTPERSIVKSQGDASGTGVCSDDVKNETADVKNELADSTADAQPSVQGPDSDFDPMKAMDWKDGIGTLPGSNLKVNICQQ